MTFRAAAVVVVLGIGIEVGVVFGLLLRVIESCWSWRQRLCKRAPGDSTSATTASPRSSLNDALKSQLPSAA